MMNTFDQIKAKATLDKIPSMTQDGLFYCEHLIHSQSISSILEIGTGYGIWSISMALLNKAIHITSLELLEKRSKMAQSNIKVMALQDQISVVNTDALSYVPKQQFDLIFIDGPKSQNKVLFLRYLPYLNPLGYILVDNIDFHGETKTDRKDQSRDLKQMVRKINDFKTWIFNQSDLNVVALEIGDGLILISRKY
jgi:predicted O-methyltransferase YrrM